MNIPRGPMLKNDEGFLTQWSLADPELQEGDNIMRVWGLSGVQRQSPCMVGGQEDEVP